MKRIIAMLLALAAMLSLAGCGKTETAETEAAPTTVATEPETEPTTVPTEPEWEPGTIRAGDLGVVWRTYQRGDKVTVIGKWGNYYVVQEEEVDHLVDLRLLRLDGEEIPEESVGYARYKTMVYSNPYFRGEAIITLPTNKKVQVLESNADWMLIQWDEGSGYVIASQISPWYIQSGGSSSGGDGGGSGGSGGGGGSSGGQDGSDVNLDSLAAYGDTYQVTLLGAYHGPAYEEMEPTEGTILADGTEGYVMLLRRGDEVKVTHASEESCTLYMDGLEGSIPRWAVSLAEDEAYAPWEAYARWNTVVYSEQQCITEIATFNTNQKVEVVDALTEMGLYVVLVDGQIGYASMEKLNQYPVRSQTPSDSGGDSGSGGSGGGGAEWTPPVL